MSKKKILHIIWTMDIGGGVETWLMNVLRNIDRAQFPMDFLCVRGIKGEYAKEIESYGSKIIPLPYKKTPAGLLKFSLKFIKLLRENNYRILHVHAYYSAGFYLFLAYLARVPIRIVHSHTTSEPNPGTPIRKLFRKFMKIIIRLFATCGIGVSDPSAKELFGKSYKQDNKWKIIFNGIDASAYLNFSEQVRISIRKELGIPDNFFVIGHVGRFSWEKNHAFIVNIAKETIRRETKVRFFLIGDGPLRAEIEKSTKEQGLNDYFIFTGIRDDVPRLLQAVDIFIFPSFFEGLPLAVIEAQLSGLRCLVSDCLPSEAAFMPEFVTFININRGSKTWAQETLRLLNKPRPDQSEVIKNFKKSQFTVDLCVKRLTEVYNH